MSDSKEKVIRIGCFSAFWGDTPTAASQLVHSSAKLDYIVGDYLAEVTMCILARMKDKMAKAGTTSTGRAGEGGYVADFLKYVWQPLMSEIMTRKIKVVTNAGGMNPAALKRAIEESAKAAGAPIPVVAVVLGDDLTPQAKKLYDNGSLIKFSVSGEEEALWSAKEKVMSCNAYLGAVPIAQALAGGADIVITGRTVDSALVLGPLLHEFGWKANEYDLLSAGSLAGHIVECGCQCTGGNFTDWKDSYEKGWDNVGFPIVECFKDGSFIVTKPDETGGLVSFGTVAEQMLYEIHDPAAYILPDVICDWTQVSISDLPLSSEQKAKGLKRSDRVLVKGAKGRPATPYYKIGATTMNGFKTSASLLISGFDAVDKANAVADGILKKVRGLLQMYGMPDFIETKVELLGAEATYGHLAQANTREIVLRITVLHSNPKALGIFALELAPSATGMAPGITGAGSRPKPTPRIKYYSCLIEKSKVPYIVQIAQQPPTTYHDNNKYTDLTTQPPSSSASSSSSSANTSTSTGNEPKVTVPLLALCYGRSGDKGDVCDIGVIAREPRFYEFIKQTLTEKVVHDYLKHLIAGTVKRYELPGVSALNFVCTRSLGGGGTSSLAIDTQGKSYAQKLLSFPIQIPSSWLTSHTKSMLPISKL